MARRKRYLFVCTNQRPPGAPKGSCGERGASMLYPKLKALLQARGLADVDVRACASSCLDLCWRGPVIAVEPDDYFYGGVQESDLVEIVDALCRGERLERLVIGRDEFTDPAARAREGS